MAVKDFMELGELEQIETILKKGFPMGEGKNLKQLDFGFGFSRYWRIDYVSINFTSNIRRASNVCNCIIALLFDYGKYPLRRVAPEKRT